MARSVRHGAIGGGAIGATGAIGGGAIGAIGGGAIGGGARVAAARPAEATAEAEATVAVVAQAVRHMGRRRLSRMAEAWVQHTSGHLAGLHIPGPRWEGYTGRPCTGIHRARRCTWDRLGRWEQSSGRSSEWSRPSLPLRLGLWRSLFESSGCASPLMVARQFAGNMQNEYSDIENHSGKGYLTYSSVLAD